MKHPLRIEQRDACVVVEGELDSLTAPLVREALAGFDGLPIVVDLSGLTFVDSSGLRALLDAKRLHPQLDMVNPSVFLRRILDLTGTSSLLLARSTA